MAAEPAQARSLAPLITEDIPESTEPQIVSPPPAYYPPANSFLRTASFPLQYGAYDAHQTITSPTAAAQQQEYVEYFTALFTTWIQWGVIFYKYGFPVIKWSSLFFVTGLGGWREYWLLAGWFLVWCAPGLYFGFLGKEIGDLQRFKGENEAWVRVVYEIFFWGAWSAIVGSKFVSLWYVMRMQSWWLWPALGGWMLVFGV